MVNPIIDQIAGDMERSDFDIVVRPAGGEATKETAKTYDGLIRNIENISGAYDIYNGAGRNAITCGIDGWRVVQKYVDDNSFDQDLVIERIGNYIDRVWHGPHEEPDASDATMCWILSGLTRDEYKARFPDAGTSGVTSDRTAPSYFHRQDLVMVGEFLYLKPVERELVLMSDQSVHEVDDEFEKIVDELAQQGITEVRRRRRTKHVVCSRLFDMHGWLKDPATGKDASRETVFENWIPVIPMYANFKYYEDKILYWGAVEKLLDPQRVMNYSMSREIEEGALAPRNKPWMTPAQAEGHEQELATLNVDTAAYQLYNADPEAPNPPPFIGGAQVNPGLRTISEAMRDIIGQSAGMFAANMGDNPGLQSGVAISALQDRGDTGNNKYILAREIAQRQTGKILVNAIPRVYGPGRQVRLLKEDGGYDMATISQVVIDQQTGTPVVVNDLSVGTYDTICESGPSFKNRQNEAVTALRELGNVDPGIIEIAKDVLLTNIPAPGMDQVARRVRRQLFQAGVIPFEDMTDEEKQEAQAMAQQPPQESPEMVLARAEELKGQADLVDAQTKQAQVQGELQVKVEQIKLEQQKLQLQAYSAETDRIKVQIEAQQAGADIKAKSASALKSLSEAEAQDIENDMTVTGVSKMLDNLQRVNSGGA